MSSYDLLIKNGLCVLPDGIAPKDVGIKDGHIVAISDSITDSANEIIDAQGKHVLPGIIDSQVHFRDPGLTHKEDLETGSKAAALGGVTHFLEMPNTSPPTTTVDAIKEKLALAEKKCVTGYGFFVGATGENLDDLLEAVKVPGCCGIKIFLGSSTGSLLLYDQDKLLEIFKTTDAPIAVHSENEEMLKSRVHIRNEATSAHQHPVWRNEETALSSTKMIIEIAKKAGRKVHILHITSKKEIEFLKDQKEHCTVECTPQHLTLSAPECYDKLGTYAQMNPPIRSEEHRLALWEGVKNGTVDVFGSDHAPHTREEKDKGYPNSPSGMPGVQTILPLMLNHVNQGHLSLEKMVYMLSTRPAELYHFNKKGNLKVNNDGDITIVDLNQEHTISNSEQASRCGWTPFDGVTVKGYPTHTIVKGKIVMENGELK